MYQSHSVFYVQRPGVQLCYFKRVFADVRKRDLCLRRKSSYRKAYRAASATKIEDFRAAACASLTRVRGYHSKGFFSKDLCVEPRDQDSLIYMEAKSHELLLTRYILERGPFESLVYQLTESLFLPLFDFAVQPERDHAERDAHNKRQEGSRVERSSVFPLCFQHLLPVF